MLTLGITVSKIFKYSPLGINKRLKIAVGRVNKL